jgi:hypothetical protein
MSNVPVTVRGVRTGNAQESLLRYFADGVLSELEKLTLETTVKWLGSHCV